jgi:hypothetical protein
MKKYFVPKEGFITAFSEGFLGYSIDYGKLEAWAFYKGAARDVRDYVGYEEKVRGNRMKEIPPSEAALLFGEV